MVLRYALSEIRKHSTDTQWWRKRFLTHVVARYFTDLRPRPCDRLCEQDWDNVLLLDACRYDLYESVVAGRDPPGTVGKRRSCASGTPAYLAENFAAGNHHDVVYVTANPYVATELDTDVFHAVDHVWRDGWDDERGTVMPDTMRERALSAAGRYPDKRLVVHFNQPHVPFVGDVRLEGRGMGGIRHRALEDKWPDPSGRGRTPFEQLGAGEVSKDRVWRAYRSNLEVALPAVEALLSELDGRTAVTADHGNALGERAWPFPIRVYGHPLGIHVPALTDVPWHVVDQGIRKRTTSEPPEGTSSPNGPVGEAVDETVQERLQRLGYTE